jgi:cation diffusion facilitator CzcD-associated flavoprotein CzcO
VHTASGQALTARVVVAGTGPLHIPKIPSLRGTFAGQAFHSAQWDHSVDLRGKNVAVIGTGASGAQFIPQIAEQAAHLRVFQRTPHWVLPKLDRPITAAERAAYRLVPGLRKLVRSGIYLSHESLTAAFLNPKYMRAVRGLALWHLHRQVADPQLRKQLTPDYEIGCKRMIMASDYYPALQRDNVTLVTGGIEELTPGGIRTQDGTEHPADVIIYATGFAVADKMDHHTLVGRDGLSIQQAWRNGPESYLGLATHGFPNYFTLMGPNTGVGNQSVVFLIEAQVRYITACITALKQRECTRVEVKSHIQAQYNRDLQRRSEGTVWTAGGCSSWYIDSEGVNRAIWPGTTLSYWWQTRIPDLSDFEFTRSADREEDEDYHGPAVLTTADGTEIEVRAHLLAVYQPIDNSVHWSGRLYPDPQLTAAHTVTGQAVTLHVPGREPVPATLLDADPWGGSHIAGRGLSPYPMPLETELAALLREADTRPR